MATIRADKNIPTAQSMAEDWIAWYKSIPGGRDVRNQAFLAVWRQRGSSKANTNSLRTFLLNEAGITLTTDNIGNLTDAVYSFGDRLETLTMLPLYVLAGGSILFVLLAGFMFYQAIKNPEATGKIIGAAGTAAGNAAKAAAI